MHAFFSWSTDHDFSLFSNEHLVVLGTIVVMMILMFLFRNNLREHSLNFIFRIGIAIIILLSEASFHIWFIYHNEWDVAVGLPLQLSSISLFLAVFLVLTKNRSLFEITYFAGAGSAILAMLTPDLGVYGYPHFRFFHFFVAHGGIVIATWSMIIVEGFVPSYRSIWKAFFALNAYVTLIFILNITLNANYMFLMEKPLSNTLFAYLGPWPWYLLSLEGVAIVAFHLLYLPFTFSKWLNKTRRKISSFSS
ncbi:TIGR02206 family membrane protein [Pseudalkalibacillus hwajinpoensis]|uniref:YwaF family protein n=1 Tax=Guptibacillus hwajinpoensis TaxID=208199 RepID=UPI00325AD4FC